VLRTHRKLGIATKLMTAAQNAMEQVWFVLILLRVCFYYSVISSSDLNRGKK